MQMDSRSSHPRILRGRASEVFLTNQPQGASARRSANVYIPQTVLAQLRGSYLFFIVIPLCSRIAGGQPKYLSLKYLSPAGDSLCSRIAGGQPKYLSLKYISPAADSLCSRIAGGQPKYLSLKYLSPAADSLCSRIAGGQPKYLSLKYQTVLAQLRGSYLFPKQRLHN